MSVTTTPLPVLGGAGAAEGTARAPWMLASIALFVVGTVVQVLSYGTLQVLVPTLTMLGLGVVLMVLLGIGGRYEYRAYFLTFSVCWFWAGVAAFYANQLDEYIQNYQDAGRFFDLVTSGSVEQLSLEELALMTTGAGAVAIWRAIYDFFWAIGFERGRYIGIAVNVLLVAMTGVVAVKIVRTIFGEDAARLRRVVVIYAMCGVFWLFAATHLRDAAGLLGVTALALVWVRYLATPGVVNLAWLVVATVLAFGFFGFLRAQFLFVPLAMLASGVAALMFSSATKRKTRVLIVIAAIVIGLPMLAAMIAIFQSDLVDFLLRGNQQYTEMSQSQADVDSLGTRLIVEAPLPLRILFGSGYMFVFPIPIWSGFTLETVYYLLKSLHAIYMYFVTPLFVYGSWQVLRRQPLRTAPILFMLFVSIGFTLSIAATSLETRHFGAFLVPVMIIALLPDLTKTLERDAARNLTLLLLTAMMGVHLVWLGIKLGS